MDVILSAAIVILILGALVFIHELGHYLVAKRAGVVVQEFAFGFGPKIVAKEYHGTVYRINCIPLGGYVKMLGDQDASSFLRYQAAAYNEADKTFALELLKKHKLDPQTSNFHEIELFYNAQEKQLAKEDFIKLQNYYTKDYIPNHPGNYDNKSIKARVAINAAGVVMNFILGSLLFYLLFFITGYKVDLVKVGDPSFLGGQIASPPVITKIYGDKTDTYVGAVVLEANGDKVYTADQFNTLLKANYNKPIHLYLQNATGYVSADLVLDGDGVKSNFDADVADKIVIDSVDSGSAADKAKLVAGDVVISFAGQPVNTLDDFKSLIDANKGKSVPLNYYDPQGNQKTATVDLPQPAAGQPVLGVTFAQNSGYFQGLLRVNYLDNKLASGFLHSINITLYNITGIASLVSQSIAQRSLQPVSSGVGSIVGIADVVYSLVKVNDFQNILNLAAMVSVTLAFMNILPIPLFDGGNLLFLLIEKVKGKPLSAQTQEKVGTISFFILVVLIILIMVKDVVQFNWIGRIFNAIRGIFVH